MPYGSSFQRSFEWLTLSNALETSRRIRPVCLPRLDLQARSSMSETKWVSQERPRESCAVGRT